MAGEGRMGRGGASTGRRQARSAAVLAALVCTSFNAYPLSYDRMGPEVKVYELSGGKC